MAGLLDQFGEFLNTPGGMGLLSAVGAGLAGARRGQPLNAFGAGLLGGAHGYNQAQELKQQTAFNNTRQKLLDSQVAENELQAKARQQALDAQQAQRSYLSSIGQVTSPVIGAQPNKFDPMRGLALGMSPELVKTIADAPNMGRAEVARTLEGQDEQGNKITYQFDKYGQRVGDGVQGYTAPVQVDLGGRVQFVKPQAGVGFAKSMTPGEVAADRRAGERLRFDKEQSAQNVTYQQDANGNFVALPTKSAPGAVVRGSPVVSGPGMTPLQGKGGGMTEDQAKATGWLSQAENAWRNMQSVMYQRDEKGQIKSGQNGPVLNKDVISPGFFEANTPGEAGNRLRSPQRQQFVQASESIGEALLRAATGAGVNKDEAAQKARELTPQRGDSEQVIQQKMASIPVYLESLRVRAGPGAKKVPSAGPVTGQFLGFE